MSSIIEKTIEYITIPLESNGQLKTYEIADKTWRQSPAKTINQGDIINWNKKTAGVTAVITGYYYNDNFYQDSNYSILIPGEENKIYIDKSQNKSYRYDASNTQYIVINGNIDNNITNLIDGNQSGSIKGIHTILNNTEGIDSIALGKNTKASGQAQTVIGKYNEDDINGNYAFIIGNGNSSTLSNALQVNWDGIITINSSITPGEFNNHDLVTKEYVDNKIEQSQTLDRNISPTDFLSIYLTLRNDTQIKLMPLYIDTTDEFYISYRITSTQSGYLGQICNEPVPRIDLGENIFNTSYEILFVPTEDFQGIYLEDSQDNEYKQASYVPITGYDDADPEGFYFTPGHLYKITDGLKVKDCSNNIVDCPNGIYEKEFDFNSTFSS